MPEPINARTLTVEQLTDLAALARERAEWTLALAADQAVVDVESGRYRDEPTPAMMRAILALRDQAAADDTPAGRVRRLARVPDEIRALPLGNNELSHKLLAISSCIERIGHHLDAGTFDTLELVRAIALAELPEAIESLGAMCLRRRVVDVMEPITQHVTAAAALAVLVAEDLRPADLAGIEPEAKALLSVDEPDRCRFCGCPPDAMPCRDTDGGPWNDATSAAWGANCTAEDNATHVPPSGYRSFVLPSSSQSMIDLLPKGRPNILAGLGEAMAKAPASVISTGPEVSILVGNPRETFRIDSVSWSDPDTDEPESVEVTAAEVQAVIDGMSADELLAMKGVGKRSEVVIIDMAHVGFGQPFAPVVAAFNEEVTDG